MAKKKEDDTTTEPPSVSPNDLGWTDYVLNLLSDDEKISGNPTTDGLRRIFEIALNCTIINSTSLVAQAPDPHNEKRATVVHSLTYVLNNCPAGADFKIKTVDGAADVYWGNCDKIYRNHPVAVAETRAEGRALRRGLKLRKVVAAEEVSDHLEDDPDENSVSKISHNQINFIDVLSQRLNINVLQLLITLDLSVDSVYNISHANAVQIIQQLNRYQQDAENIPDNILGYNQDWK